MAEPEARRFESERGLSYVRLGNEGAPLFVFDAIRLENGPPEGLVLQGLLQTFDDYAGTFLPVICERRQEMAIDYSISDMADDYAALMKELTDEPEFVLGFGIGGVVGMELAARYPELVKRLVVVGAAYRLREEARKACLRWAEWASELRWRRVHFELVRAMSSSPHLAPFYGAIAALAPKMLGTPDYPWDFVVSLRAEAEADLMPHLPEIKAPTLVVAGDRDFFYSREDLETTADWIPNGELHLLRGVGHGIARSHRNRVRELVERFLLDE